MMRMRRGGTDEVLHRKVAVVVNALEVARVGVEVHPFLHGVR